MSLFIKAAKFVAVQVLGNAADELGQHIGDGLGRRIKRRLDPLGAFYEEVRIRAMMAELANTNASEGEADEDAEIVDGEDEDDEKGGTDDRTR